MLNINNYSCTGRLTRDPESKALPSGKSVCKMSIAINNPYQKNGEWKDDPIFMDIDTFGDTADRCAQYEKGQGVYVEGRLKQDNWEDKDGNKKSKIKMTASTVKTVDKAESGTTERSGRSGKPNPDTYKQQRGGPSENLNFGGDDAEEENLPF